jgi:hypothetical protein
VQHLVMPVTVLAVVQASGWSRYLRGSMIETLAQPFVLAARARGIPGRDVIVRHALRNAMGPVLAIVMVDAALLVSGAVVTESVFAWPGLGSLFTEALARRDYSVLMALLMLTSTAIVVFNVVADAAHALIDPASWSVMRTPTLLLVCLVAAALAAPRSHPTRRINSTLPIAAKRLRPPIALALTTSDAMCSPASCTAHGCRSPSVCCRRPSRERLASPSAASPDLPEERRTRC